MTDLLSAAKNDHHFFNFQFFCGFGQALKIINFECRFPKWSAVYQRFELKGSLEN